MKKVFLSFVLIMVSNIANANSFDSFVGEYTLVGSPTVQKVGSFKECLRFGFLRLTGFSVIQDTKGYNQSHMLHFNNQSGWSGHPVMDFDDLTPSFHNYAKTSGSDVLAQNEYTSIFNNRTEQLLVSIEKNGSEFLLNVTESYVENGQLIARCAYSANLDKVP